MRVFVTGATGNIGSAVVAELIGAGHSVLGLCRNPAKADALRAAGAQVHHGSIDDHASLAAGAAQADGVIHLAFNHDFSRFAASCEEDRAIVGADRHPRAASEEAAAAVAAAGANVSVMRLPQVHDPVSQGLVTPLVALFRQLGKCIYVGDGSQRWPAAHLSDVARAYRLALERAQPGAKYHAVAEEGVAMREIVETVGRRLQLPVESIAPEQAQSQFGWLALFAGHDFPASSEQTRRWLGWTPTGPGLIEDLRRLELADAA
ncbi:NAD-dependent epimerase/dehydratase family protein [Lysobacter enzymogenes]|uniref:NAD-dependent epimerase/dehydratase family protein n=1 Tax=Lysobacter enzymogenes TaxID=69 RepID=UPI00384AF999